MKKMLFIILLNFLLLFSCSIFYYYAYFEEDFTIKSEALLTVYATKDYKKVLVNGKEVQLTDGKYTTKVPVKMGKNEVVIEYIITDKKKRIIKPQIEKVTEKNYLKKIKEKENKFSKISISSAKQIDGIKYGLKKGYSVRSLYSIRSDDYAKMYFVAGIVNGKKARNEVCVWSTNADNDSGMFFSVDSNATKYSDYPLGLKTKAEITMDRDGAKIVQEYVKLLLE